MDRVGQHALQWRFWFGEADNRPVALFRIAFGLVLLKDAIYHLFLADIFYSGNSLWPAPDSFSIWPLTEFSLFYLSDSLSWALFLMIIWIIVLVALIVGYRSRWMALANLIIIISVQERTPLVLTGADAVMSVMSFWLLVLPLAEHYSWDSRRRGGGALLSYAFPLRLAQLQFCFIYLQTALLKIWGGAWFDGNALHYALNQAHLTSPLTDWVMGWMPAWLLIASGIIVWLIEISFIFWIFVPYKQPNIRLIALVSGYLLHLGIAILMAIQDFPLVMMVGYFLLWEGEWTATFVAKVRAVVPLWAGRGAGSDAVAVHQVAHSRREKVKRVTLTIGLIYIMFGILWLLARGTLRSQIPPVGGVTATVIRSSGLTQNWRMFSYGESPGQDVWVVVEGAYEDGRLVDLQRGQPIPGDDRRWLWGPTARFKKYEENMIDDPEATVAWAEHYCRRERVEEDGLLAVTVQYWRREINPLGDPAGIYQPETMQILYSLNCSEWQE